MKENRPLSWPALLWYGVLLLGPLLWIFALSFQTRGTYGGIVWKATLENYFQVFDSTYFWIVGRSLVLAFFTATISVGLALGLSWAVVSVEKERQLYFLAALVLPFLINLIIRVYALKSFLGFDGPFQVALKFFHIDFDPFSLTANNTLVCYGMVTAYLPFAILPVYSALSRFDFSLFEAALDLGASYNQAFVSVIVPCLKKAILSAWALVFIPALGEYVIPDLLGGAKTMYLGNLLTEQFLKTRNWPFGSALASAMILVLLFGFWLISRRKQVVADG